MMYGAAVPWYLAAALPESHEPTSLACLKPCPLVEVCHGEGFLGAINHMVTCRTPQKYEVGLWSGMQEC